MKSLLPPLCGACTTAVAGRYDEIAVTSRPFTTLGSSARSAPAIKRKNLNLDVQLLIVGHGSGLALGEAGECSKCGSSFHSKKAEEAFVAERNMAPPVREIQYIRFVLIGPSDDPAQIQ